MKRKDGKKGEGKYGNTEGEKAMCTTPDAWEIEKKREGERMREILPIYLFKPVTAVVLFLHFRGCQIFTWGPLATDCRIGSK